MLRACPKKPEWYEVDATTWGKVAFVPGAKVDEKTGSYLIHRTHLPILFDHPEAVREQARLASFKSDWDKRDLQTVDRGFRLRNVQHEAVDFAQGRPGVLFAHSPRLGKTLCSVMSHEEKLGSFVAICPASVRSVWIGWIRKVFPDADIGVLKGKTFDPALMNKPFVVGHYDILHAWQSSQKIGTIVFDEAHFLANRKSRRTNAALFLARQAQKVIAATGTPIWNMPTNLWALLGLVSPAAFGGYEDFSSRYGNPEPGAYGTKYTGISNEQELQSRLTEIMLLRKWRDVESDLPPVTRNVVLAEVSDTLRRKLDILAAALAEGSASTTVGLIATYREQLSKIKLPVVVTEALNILDRGEPLVIWTWHVWMATEIARQLGDRAFLLTGEVPSNKRDGIIEGWKIAPQPSALIATMPVAQVGLDFSHAHIALFGEIDYTPAILSQAEMRTYAATRAMNLTYVLADHIVDQRMVLALIKKLNAANPLGVGAADEAISVLQEALQGPKEEADMSRFLDDLLAA